MVPINVDEYFGDKSVKMTWAKTPPKEEQISKVTKEISNKSKNIKNPELGIHGDKDFEKTLKELDTPSKSKKRKKKAKNPELKVHGDENFEKTLEELDDDYLINNLDILDKTIEEATHNVEVKGKADKNRGNKDGLKENSPTKKGVNENQSIIKNAPDVPKTEKKRQRNTSEDGGKKSHYIFYIHFYLLFIRLYTKETKVRT